MKKILILAILALVAPWARSTEPELTLRPVLSSYTFGVGSAHIVDTYLTPLRYSGWNATLAYERMQAMRFDPEHWVMRLRGRAWGGVLKSPARNVRMQNIEFALDWSMLHRWRPAKGWQIHLGGTTGATAGVDYLGRNGNNPVSAKAAWTVGVDAAAVWNMRIKRLPITWRYTLNMPVAGVFFSPQYGELYYEIWLGDHSRLAHVAWPGNYRRFDNLLTADLHLGNTNLRLGYRAEVLSWRANNLTSRLVQHQFVIGFTTEWISLKASSTRTPDARIISALY